MGKLQRYVSDELTHFVGRGLPPPDQFATLLKVLRDGALVLPRQGHGDEPPCVCFCDIPVGDLDLHIEKYSAFGVAFRKAFVLEQGASPVFYVAARATRHARLRRDLDALRQHARERLPSAPPDEARHLRALLDVGDALDAEVWSYVKLFEYPADEDAPQNTYMEREWRLLAPLRFRLDDVRRVILPEAYAARFRAAFPGYAGQVTFAGGER